jgi:hypothetical protein
MTDLETLLQMRGRRYERARIEARSEEIATRFFLSQKERTHFEVRGKTDLEVLRGLQDYRDSRALSASLAVFVVLLVTVAFGFAFAIL